MDFEEVRTFREIFQRFNIRGYLVGGAVRDIYIGENPTDFDFAAEISEEDHIKASDIIGKYLNCKYEYNDFYHTSKFYIKNGEIDFVMARSETYNGIASRPSINNAYIIDDLKRRDFTINAIAVELFGNSFKIIDPLFGIKDVDAGTLRVLHKESFMDDPTRIFRGLKYASRFKFDFDPLTKNLIHDAVEKGYVTYLSGERIKLELMDVLSENNFISGLKMIRDYNILDFIIKSKVNINFNIKEDEFKAVPNIYKLVSLLYNNSETVLIRIAETLNTGVEFIMYSKIAKDVEGLLECDNDSILSFLIGNQRPGLPVLLKIIFYKNIRIKNYLKYRDYLNVDMEDIKNVDIKDRREYVIHKKVERLKMLITGGAGYEGI